MNDISVIISQGEKISDPLQWYQFFGKVADEAIDNKNIVAIDAILDVASSKEWDDRLSYIFTHYLCGNLWTAKDELKRKDTGISIWDFQLPELTQAVIYFRRCIAIIPETLEQKQCVTMAYTNLAGKMDHVGRFFKAFEYWDLAITHMPEFAMAHCNKAYALYYYAKILDTGYKSNTYLHTAYRLLVQYADSPYIHKMHQPEFIKIKDEIWNNCLNKSFLSTPLLTSNKSNSKINKKYDSWCWDEHLYLDALLGVVPIRNYWGDVELLNPISFSITQNHKSPMFNILFNQIKQEYISARYFLYLSSDYNNEELHFSDIGRHLSFCGDMALYGIKLEYMKMAFRDVYSIFDKIAFFIKNYFDLPGNEHLSFNNVWFRNKKIHDKIANSKNLGLRGLFFLSRDLYSKDEDWITCLDPEAKEIADIRNKLEHAGFKLIHPFAPDGICSDTLSYSIKCDEFYLKTLSLFRLVREAILYLNIAVEWNERQKNREKLVMPLILGDYDYID